MRDSKKDDFEKQNRLASKLDEVNVLAPNQKADFLKLLPLFKNKSSMHHKTVNFVNVKRKILEDDFVYQSDIEIQDTVDNVFSVLMDERNARLFNAFLRSSERTRNEPHFDQFTSLLQLAPDSATLQRHFVRTFFTFERRVIVLEADTTPPHLYNDLCPDFLLLSL